MTKKRSKQPRSTWGEQEDCILKEFFPTLRFSINVYLKIRDQIPWRSASGVASRLKALREKGEIDIASRIWTDEELRILKEKAIALHWCNDLIAASILEEKLIDRSFNAISTRVAVLKRKEGIASKRGGSKRSDGTRKKWTVAHEEILVRFLESLDPEESLTFDTIDRLLATEGAQEILGSRSYRQLLFRLRELRSEQEENPKAPPPPGDVYLQFKRSLIQQCRGRLLDDQIRTALDMAKTDVTAAHNYVKYCFARLPQYRRAA